MVRTALVDDVHAWIAADPDASDQAALCRLLARADFLELERQFAQPLTFGTAGLRGPLVPGPSGMNRATVRQATLGVIEWVTAQGPATMVRGVVVGRDARTGSEQFCADVAALLAAYGIPAYVLAGPLPTPLVPFAVVDRGAAAGIMVTASHNPREDNGYKVYDATGAQVLPEACAAIEATMARLRAGGPAPLVVGCPAACIELPADLWPRYRDPLVARYGVPAGAASPVRIAYTPLHGVAGRSLVDLFAHAGFSQLAVVDAEFCPDPQFPGMPFPNPEEPGVLDGLLALAEHTGADIAVANDPDGDRLAVMIPLRSRPGGGSRWRALSGDEVGAVLGWSVLQQADVAATTVATTIVSSRLLAAMAADHGVPCVETLTGFRWIARAGRRPLGFPDRPLSFGYEEALGYALDPRVPDKDGLSAALAITRLVHDLAQDGRTLEDLLEALDARYGVHVTTQRAWRATPGPAGEAAHEELLAKIRDLVRCPPQALVSPDGLARFVVDTVTDLSTGSLSLPPTDGVVLQFRSGTRVVLRPSGTEHKVKAYIEVVTTASELASNLARPRAVQLAAQLGDALDVLLNP